MLEPRVIKRYANRKLYDTSRSSYVTLEEIASFIKSGEDIRIIDNKTKADITSVTMAQILVEEEKRGRPGPLPSLRQLIEQSGGLLQRAIEPVTHLKSTVDERVKGLVTGLMPSAQVQRELARLHARLDRIEAHLGLHGDPPNGDGGAGQ